MPHKYAFQQIYVICPLRGKPHPTFFLLMVQVLLPLGCIIVKYYNYSNSVLSPLNPILDATQVWVEFPLLVIKLDMGLSPIPNDVFNTISFVRPFVKGSARFFSVLTNMMEIIPLQIKSLT